MLVSAKDMLVKAKAGKYAVGQFNINNLEWTKAILLTAQELNSPVILGVSEGAGKYMTGFKTVVGMVNGIGVAIGDLPPFIMTLGSMTAVRGLALLTSNGKPITGISKEYKAVAASSIAGIPMLSVFLVIVIIICAFVLSKTVYGRRVYACGGNLQAARVSGINTTAIRISTFAIAGLLAGLCGFLMTSRVTIGQPTAAESYEMDAITACVVGGVSMTGGVGKPWGVVIGCLLITVIANGLDIMGVSSHWQKIVKGVIIVVAVLIDVKGKTKKN